MKAPAGPELDLAIAKAIGLETAALYKGKVFITPREWDAIRGIEHTTCEGGVACFPFQPSVDLNAAFEAAEKAGLFEEYHLFCAERQTVAVWEILEFCDDPFMGEELLADGPTPALAICAAILKLKLKEKVDG